MNELNSLLSYGKIGEYGFGSKENTGSSLKPCSLYNERITVTKTSNSTSTSIKK